MTFGPFLDTQSTLWGVVVAIATLVVHLPEYIDGRLAVKERTCTSYTFKHNNTKTPHVNAAVVPLTSQDLWRLHTVTACVGGGHISHTDTVTACVGLGTYHTQSQ